MEAPWPADGSPSLSGQLAAGQLTGGNRCPPRLAGSSTGSVGNPTTAAPDRCWCAATGRQLERSWGTTTVSLSVGTGA